MEHSNYYQPYFAHIQGAIATNPSQDMRMSFPLNQQNLVDAPSHHLFINEPYLPQNNENLLQNNENNKSRLQWTEELHSRFLDAVHELGGAFVATPKAIRTKMGVNSLTLHHLKSHLQKFRQSLTSRRLVRRRNKPQEAPNAYLDARFSDGSGSSNSTIATSSYIIEAEPLDVQNHLENNQSDDDHGLRFVPDQSVDRFDIEELVVTVQPTPVVPHQSYDQQFQVPTSELGQLRFDEDETDLLSLIVCSPINDYMNHFDPSGDIETENLSASSEPTQENDGSYEEVVEALPPIVVPSFTVTRYWTMDDLLSMEIDKPWYF